MLRKKNQAFFAENSRVANPRLLKAYKRRTQTFDQMQLTLTPQELQTLASQITEAVYRQLAAEAKQAVAHNRLLTVAEAASLLKMSQKTICKYLREGILVGKNFGTLDKPVWRVLESSLHQLMNV